MSKPTDRAPAAVRTRSVPLALAAAFVALAPCGARAADSCRMYSGPNQTGASHLVNLPGIQETHSPVWWSTSSRRAIGEELDGGGGAVYENAESIRIVAGDTAVAFYAYTGDNMDGVFQVVRCAEGNTCNWTFGSMRNQVRSFNCQRDLDGIEIPTVEIADSLTEQLDVKVPQSGSIDTSTIKYGRIAWTNLRARCERTGVGCGSTWQDKYKDTLEYVGKLGLEPSPAWWYKQYDAWFTFWLNPEVVGAAREFRVEETWYHLQVESGAVRQQILDGLESGIQPLFDGNQDLGEQITTSIWDAIVAEVGPFWASGVIANNQRIYPDYACAGADFADHRPRWPGYSYSAFLQSHPCGYGMPTYAYPPVLNLVKSF